MPALDTPAVDQRKLEAFVGQIVCEVGAVLAKLGVAGRAEAAERARKLGLAEVGGAASPT